jgi:hypothetical protein
VFVKYPVQSLSGLGGHDGLAFHRFYGECEDSTVRYAMGASFQILPYLLFILLYHLLLYRLSCDNCFANDIFIVEIALINYN